MKAIFLAMPAALALAGAALAQGADRQSPAAPQAKVPPVEFQSAFEGYRPFADPERQDWRQANEEVGAAGGHAGHRPHQGSGEKPAKPQPGKAEGSDPGDHHNPGDRHQ